MIGIFYIHALAALLASSLADVHPEDTCSATAGCEAAGETEGQDNDEMLLIQKFHTTTPKREGGARLSALAPTQGSIPPALVLADVQRSLSEVGVPSWRQEPLLVLCAAALGLLFIQGLASMSTVSSASPGPAGHKASQQAGVDVHRPLPPGVFVATMACAFLSEASCTAAMPTAHLCAGGLLSSVGFWFLGRLISAPLFWYAEKKGLTQLSLAVHCIAMASGQVLYGMCAAKLLFLPRGASTASPSLLNVLLMASRVAVGFASGAQFSASAAVVAQAGAQRRTEYLCYWAFAGGVGALAGPGLGSFSLAGAKTELEMLLPCAFLAGASLILLYSLPSLNDSQASALVQASEAEMSPRQQHRATGAVTLNVLMQMMRQAMCLLWEAGTAAVLVKQFGLDDQDARTLALGIVAASLLALTIGAKFGSGSDEPVLLMWSSAIAAFGCCVRFRFSTAADGAGIFALAAFAGYAGSFLSLAPMVAFAGKACSDASGAESPASFAAWRQVLMSHHVVSSAGVATVLAALWSPSSGTPPQPPSFAGFVMHFAVLMLIAVQAVPQMGGLWRSSSKFRGAHAQQQT